MTPGSSVVAVFASPESALCAALRGALIERGWAVVMEFDRVASRACGILLLEDDGGMPWPHKLPSGLDRVIAIGSLRSGTSLARFAGQGAAVINQDLPFLTLLTMVESVLRTDHPSPASREQGFAMASRLHTREKERHALSRLTQREREVLGGLVLGHNAAAIATMGSRSLPTIRSQIQMLMGRLGVGSQLSAVAIAHRSGLHAGLDEYLTALHQL